MIDLASIFLQAADSADRKKAQERSDAMQSQQQKLSGLYRQKEFDAQQKTQAMDAAQKRAVMTANLQRAYAAAPNDAAKQGVLEQAYRMHQGGLINRFEVAGPQTTPDRAQALQQQAAGGASAVLGPAPKPEGPPIDDIAKDMLNEGIAPNDPGWAAEHTKRRIAEENAKIARAKAGAINLGDLSGRALNIQQLAGVKSEVVNGLIDKLYAETNGNPEMFASLANKAQAGAADWAKAFGLPPTATAEELSNKQAKVKSLLRAIASNSTYKDEDGSKHNLAEGITSGANLGAELEALRSQMDVIQGVNATHGIKAPGANRPKMQLKTAGGRAAQDVTQGLDLLDHPPEWLDQLKADAAKGDQQAIQALKNYGAK